MRWRADLVTEPYSDHDIGAVLGPGLRRPAGAGPGDRRGRPRRAGPAARRPAADRQRELHLARPCSPRSARRCRTSTPRATPAGATTAAARRSTGPRRSASPGPRSCSARRPTARQPAAALRRQRQPGRLRRAAAAGRHGARDVAAARRPPHPRLEGQLLRQVVHPGVLPRPPGHRADRLRRGPRPRPRAPAEDDHRRRHGLPAADRLRPVPGDRRRGRRLADGRRRALHRAGRRQGDPVAGAVRRRRDVHDAQGAARSARRHDRVPPGAGRRGSTRRCSRSCRAAR